MPRNLQRNERFQTMMIDFAKFKHITRQLIWLCGFVLIAFSGTMFLSGCTTPATESSEQVAAMDTNIYTEPEVIDSPVVDGEDPGAEAPPLPPAKADAVIQLLENRRKAALEMERKQLMTPRLDKWLLDLKATEGKNEFQPIGSLDDKLFKAMTAQEKLAYLLFHPEDNAQICFGTAPIEGASEAIFRTLPRRDDDAAVSERQMQVVRADSNAIKKLILNSLETNKNVSVDMMRLIVELKLFKTIPALISIYEGQKEKDDLILTTLVQIMEHSNFWTWTYSDLNKLMLVDYYECVPFTADNAEKILMMAQKVAN